PQPAYSLCIGSGSHGQVTGRMLEAVESVLQRERPNLVLVYGDTNSTLAGALAAAKMHMPIAHVEAGLRSYNRRMPEEINRVLTDHLSSILFAPTEVAVANLGHEGLSREKVDLVGDIMYDAVLHFGGQVDSTSVARTPQALTHGKYVVATIHRAENTDDTDRLFAIIDGFNEAAAFERIVWPMHPRTREALSRAGALSRLSDRIMVLPPVGYREMITLERGAKLIITDSGGMQKEAFFLGVPCLTLRNETEWVELVVLGCNRVVPPTSAMVVASAIRTPAKFPVVTASPYGDGTAGSKIVRRLLASV
ncbi:MAG: non-hydrolyzing UDP-N-acetylglucosamine 2-epimerase, partial [Gemmatimonadaceae bacterium]